MITPFLVLAAGAVTIILGIAAYRSPREQHWSALGTVVGGVGTVLALGLGVWSFHQSEKLQRDVTALTLYREHLDLSIEQPLLARASCSSKEEVEASQLREKYAWFVTHGLHSFESILEALEYAEDDDREEWRSVIEEFVEIHRCYFDSRDFVSAHYDEDLTQIIESVMSKPPRETDLPWREEALQGGCVPGYEVQRTQGALCTGFNSHEAEDGQERPTQGPAADR